MLYILQRHYEIAQLTVVLAIINATNSNNLLKMVYAVSLSSKSSRKPIIFSFVTLVVAGLAVSGILYLMRLSPATKNCLRNGRALFRFETSGFRCDYKVTVT